jgi:hypothetical protein
MNTASDKTPGNTGSAAPDPSPIAARLAWLFRVSLREGCVHPLLHLVQRYRAGQRP